MNISKCLHLHSKMLVYGSSRVRLLHTSIRLQKAGSELGEVDRKLILTSTVNSVTTLKMNDPKRLNGWTGPMMMTLRALFQQYADDKDTKVLVLTGSDPYYCAGVNLSATMKPMHPRKLHSLITSNNQSLFEAFLDFPKPILVAINGPAIGACVTSATLCDAIIASEKATFNVPFAALGITPEGCSSVHFERMMGKEVADRLLNDGWKPTGAEAAEVGLVTEVVPHDKLMTRAQVVAEGWVKEGRTRSIPGGGTVQEYKAVNAKESTELADAFLAYPFLDAQYKFLKSKGKTSNAAAFWFLKTSRPLWAKML